MLILKQAGALRKVSVRCNFGSTSAINSCLFLFLLPVVSPFIFTSLCLSSLSSFIVSRLYFSCLRLSLSPFFFFSSSFWDLSFILPDFLKFRCYLKLFDFLGIIDFCRTLGEGRPKLCVCIYTFLRGGVDARFLVDY